MDSRRKFIKTLLMELPPIKVEKLLKMIMMPRSHYKVLHGLYVERLHEQEVADEILYMSLETVKRRNTEGLEIIIKSFDDIDPTQI